VFFTETLNVAAQYHLTLLTKLVGELMSEWYRKPFRRGKRRIVYSDRYNPHHLPLIRISSYKYSSLLLGGKWNGPDLWLHIILSIAHILLSGAHHDSEYDNLTNNEVIIMNFIRPIYHRPIQSLSQLNVISTERSTLNIDDTSSSWEGFLGKALEGVLDFNNFSIHFEHVGLHLRSQT